MFSIDLQSRIPIYEQLYSGITELAAKQILHPGDKIPSVRELAKELGINPNTVSKAFSMLERDGIIYSVPGRGSFLSDSHSGIIRQNAEREFALSVEKALTSGLTKNDLIELVNKTGVIS